MHRVWTLAALIAIPLGCAGTQKIPVEQMTDSRAAIRAAEEMGAEQVPSAAHHLQLAKQQTERATRLLDEGEENRAAFLLERATADAELALSLAREEPVRIEAQRLLDQVRTLQTESETP
ncbi:MAG: DUF4398 domain-containing protein [Myxococcota bacterium]|nr:DUF4398 domain-containing protein [Myxococcota bacterium]